MTLFGNTAVMPIAAPKKKRSLLPLLTVVFLASYGLMTMLIIEQGETIQAQHNLIQVLLVDSRELWAGKVKAQTDKAARDQAKNHAKSPLSQTPSTRGHAPSIQTPSTQIPSTQVPEQHFQSRAGKNAKPQTQLPQNQIPQNQVPPMPASDLGDQRRALITL